MQPNPTTTGFDVQLLSLLGDILELASSQDGTMNTAYQSLFEIEDATKEAMKHAQAILEQL